MTQGWEITQLPNDNQQNTFLSQLWSAHNGWAIVQQYCDRHKGLNIPTTIQLPDTSAEETETGVQL